ncbi:MAG: NAD(P)/FAD-dependent oxidoreductase, partial [Sphingorhabdus sp.]
RYCPVCDGYEVTDKNVAVIGTGDRGVTEAAFLRGYTKSVTLVAPDEHHNLDEAARAKADEYGIVCVDGPATIEEIVGDQILGKAGSEPFSFDSIYPALGSDVNNLLAQMAGVKCDEEGSVIVDSHQRTSIEGIYAAGDVVLGLDQISHAMGEGGVAAVTVRNDLAEKRPIMR